MTERKTERTQETGSITVICGPMFSGKSEELIRILRKAPYGGKIVQAFKPDIDDRRGKDTINTENDDHYPATTVGTSRQILEKLGRDVNVVGIDEGQFFDEDLPRVCEELAARGIKVYVAGLKADFKTEPFGRMDDLIAKAESIIVLSAFCAVCGREAHFTQRFIVEDGGKRRPADYHDPIVVVGGNNLYEPRCREHHEVPGKP